MMDVEVKINYKAIADHNYRVLMRNRGEKRKHRRLRRPTLATQSALELSPSHCPNGRLGQDLGFGGFAFALKLPELLNTHLPTVRAMLGQTSSFPNGCQIWCPIGKINWVPSWGQ